LRLGEQTTIGRFWAAKLTDDARRARAGKAALSERGYSAHLRFHFRAFML
jgi:hypothetical protein